jgi:hypothetical protein
MTITKLNAADARAMFPTVVGQIAGAELHSGFAILDMGPHAFGVMCRGEFVGCCPTYGHAKRAGERAADAADREEDREWREAAEANRRAEGAWEDAGASSVGCDAERFGDACAVCDADEVRS